MQLAIRRLHSDQSSCSHSSLKVRGCRRPHYTVTRRSAQLAGPRAHAIPRVPLGGSAERFPPLPERRA
jgi:hypothetical protein